jgi:hypothetical protein
MNDREQRGLVIAATAKIARKGAVWLCPSQSGKGKYTVSRDSNACPEGTGLLFPDGACR